MAGCNKLSDCATIGAKCNAGTCQCDETDFYNETQCINSKNFIMNLWKEWLFFTQTLKSIRLNVVLLH